MFEVVKTFLDCVSATNMFDMDNRDDIPPSHEKDGSEGVGMGVEF